MSTPDFNRWLKRSAFLNYGAAVLSVIVALFIARWMQIQYEFQPLTPFLCAIMFSAWLGGLKPGLFAVALSLLAFHHYFLSPIVPSGVEKEIPRLLLAAATALFIMSLAAAQRSAAEALRESELRLRQIAENIREVFWMATGALDEPLYVSPAYESIWGRSLERLRQQPRSFFEAIHVEDREHATSVIMAQREQELDIEYRIVRPDGAERWIRDRRFPVKDASGKVYRVAGIAEDITERKNAEEALRRSEQNLYEREELYRVLTENANDYIRVHEPDGRSIYASPSVVRLYGQEPARVFQFAHPEDLAICQQWWERVLAKGREPLLWRVRVRDGGWRWMETQGSLLQYHGQPHVMTVCRDVTEWKKAEEALKQADAHLRLVLDTTPALIHSGCPDGYLDYFNERWLKYAGRSLEDLQGWAWTATSHPEDVEEIVKKWRECLASGEPFEHESRLRRADGEYRWMLHRKVPLRDEYGIIVKWYGSSTDIEDRKLAEDALRQSECDLAEAQRVARIGNWTFDIASDTVRWSEELYRIFDIEKQAFGSKYATFLSRIHPDDRTRILQANAEARASGKPFEVEYRIKMRSDQLKHIREVGYASKDAAGAVTSLFGTAQDITELKHAEEAALQHARAMQAMSVQREEHLRLVIDTIPTMAWSVRPDGVVDFLNKRWLDYSGLSLDRYVGDPTDPIHPEDIPRVLEKWRAAMAVGEPSDDEMRLRGADGQYRWFLVRTVPLRNEQGNIVKWYGTSTDIEDRRQAEYALREAATQLEALSRRLVELQESERKELARELHDRIGQSLTALNINLNILAAALPPQASDELRARLADSEALVESTTAAIRNVMSELRPPMLDDQGLVSALDWYAKQFSARTGISVLVRGLEPAERPAQEMEIALFRVAQEALNNVVKHARASRVEITLERSGSEFVMILEDDGVGFDAAEDSVARQAGLGMVTMRERTQAFGGRLEVRAGRGDGTRLTVRVPA